MRTVMVYSYTIKPLQLFTLLVALFREYLYLMFQKMTQNSQHYFRTALQVALSMKDSYLMFGYMTKATLTNYFRITFFSSDGPTLSINMEERIASPSE